MANSKKKSQKKSLGKQGRIAHGVEIPKNAIPANFYKQSSEYPVQYYEDIHFTCAGCRAQSVWTGQQQKKYFEEQYGNKFNTPKWCTPRHRKRMAEKHDKTS